ncbi:MAG TPA: D-aminoacyl-tRNA deacylase [Candidatus Marinimicrobia bacterium]|nr:D-aminoacyl-tRNA deacylase [Candidatus Neomarinimicrobiota bacterium]MDP7330744.1 D-aminoacyl-tRNA deacylase [Candidatus Neomarinimicrobiota bacterium]HBN45251.1 D-tyrosyl-tRNA(Tyr) deacylase [Candidatus Neomarinimicrobiota bacterium]HJL75295.1 D-aminoacyl-tRNA deacylase [Candidatus Neomarinimicrobiota bacterium]HJM70357.1 D-aminoacyl-tRNA deacylase [Candidatus Neomarinimicrobiota bacterium]
MIAVLQRVTSGKVTIDDTIVGEISHGLVILLGVMGDDEQGDNDFLVNKITDLRIFNDENGKMNVSIKDVNGSALVVSQFTLCADTRKGRRPSFIHAAPTEKGNALYEDFKKKLEAQGVPVQAGEFGAMMKVSIENDGPVTIVLDSRD